MAKDALWARFCYFRILNFIFSLFFIYENFIIFLFFAHVLFAIMNLIFGACEQGNGILRRAARVRTGPYPEAPHRLRSHERKEF